ARTALVAVTFDRNGVLPVLLQPSCLLLQRVLGVGADLVAVIIKEYAVTDADLKLLDRSRRRLARGAGTAGRPGIVRRRLFVRCACAKQQNSRNGCNDLQVHLRTPYPCLEEQHLNALLTDDSHIRQTQTRRRTSVARAPIPAVFAAEHI